MKENSAVSRCEKKRLLLVDSNRALRQLYRQSIESFYHVDVDDVGLAERAFELGMRHQYDLLIIHLSLPEMNGALLNRMIGEVQRAFGKMTKALPIVYLYNEEQRQEVDELRKEAMTLHLIKVPASINVILESLKDHLPHRYTS
jgi:CheY-like chemotaxis protein